MLLKVSNHREIIYIHFSIIILLSNGRRLSFLISDFFFGSGRKIRVRIFISPYSVFILCILNTRGRLLIMQWSIGNPAQIWQNVDLAIRPNAPKEKPTNGYQLNFISPLFTEQYRISMMNDGFFVADLLSPREIEMCNEELDRLGANNTDPFSKRKFEFLDCFSSTKGVKSISRIASSAKIHHDDVGNHSPYWFMGFIRSLDTV